MVAIDRVEAALTRLELATPSLQSMRTIPLDLIAAAVQREYPEIDPLDDDQIERALHTVASRNRFGSLIVVT